MKSGTQISAFVSEETKAQVDAYVARRGVKKGLLVEEALQHYLQVLREIPEDVIIPARLVLTSSSIKELAKRLQTDEEPTEALKDLFREKQ